MSSKAAYLKRVIGLLMVLSLILAAIPNQTVLAQPPDPQPEATYSIEGDIADEYIWYYGPYYEESGNTTGGSANKSWTISSSGNYYLAIWNKGPETIHFSGYITV